mgnify:CR=1 FL=1
MQEGEKGGSKEEKPPNETAVGELPLGVGANWAAGVVENRFL